MNNCFLNATIHRHYNQIISIDSNILKSLSQEIKEFSGLKTEANCFLRASQCNCTCLVFAPVRPPKFFDILFKMFFCINSLPRNHFCLAPTCIRSAHRIEQLENQIDWQLESNYWWLQLC